MSALAKNTITLAFFAGVSEALTIDSILKCRGCKGSVVGILYGASSSIPPAIVSGIESTNGQWAVIGDIKVISPCTFDRLSFYSKHEFDDYIEKLREELKQLLGDISVKEIWINNIFSYPEKLLLEAIPDCPVNVYDNGLITYLDRTLDDCSNFNWKRFCDGSVVIARHCGRVNSAELSYVNELGVPNFLMQKNVKSFDLKEILKNPFTKTHQSDTTLSQGHRKIALIVGTSLYRSGWIGVEDEIALYHSVILDLVKRNYLVLWKEHPRTGVSFYERIAGSFGRQNFVCLNEDQSLPIELMFSENFKPNLCISISSTTLLSMQKLFGSKGYVISSGTVDGLLERLPHLMKLHRVLPRFEMRSDQAEILSSFRNETQSSLEGLLNCNTSILRRLESLEVISESLVKLVEEVAKHLPAQIRESERLNVSVLGIAQLGELHCGTTERRHAPIVAASHFLQTLICLPRAFCSLVSQIIRRRIRFLTKRKKI